MKPQVITFTGFDNDTSIDGMAELSKSYPIEWAVLFSPSRQGVDQRFPGLTKVRKLAERASESGLRLAAHLCGGHSRQIMAGGLPEGLPVHLDQFERIQVNHPAPDPFAIAHFARHYNVGVIAQCRESTWPDNWPEFDWLFDRSGGRGETPTEWPAHPGHNRFVGYAGGMSPELMPGIMSVLEQNSGLFWIDMETGVRTDDRFDLKKCRAVCEAVFGVRG